MIPDKSTKPGPEQDHIFKTGERAIYLPSGKTVLILMEPDLSQGAPGADLNYYVQFIADEKIIMPIPYRLSPILIGPYTGRAPHTKLPPVDTAPSKTAEPDTAGTDLQ